MTALGSSTNLATHLYGGTVSFCLNVFVVTLQPWKASMKRRLQREPYKNVKWARFTISLARRLRDSKKLHEAPYRKSKSGRVSGGPGLKATAAYTKLFCEAVLNAWESALKEGVGPPPVAKSLGQLLMKVGFLQPPDCSRGPTLRRMTRLVL